MLLACTLRYRPLQYARMCCNNTHRTPNMAQLPGNMARNMQSHRALCNNQERTTPSMH